MTSQTGVYREQASGAIIRGKVSSPRQRYRRGTLYSTSPTSAINAILGVTSAISLMRLVAQVVTVTLLASAFPAAVRAQSGDTTTTRELAPGVSYRKFTDKRGPWAMYLVRVNLRRADIEIRSTRALDQLRGASE